MKLHEHWLLRAAGEAGLKGADRLCLEPGIHLDEAWKRVAEACGIDQSRLAESVAAFFSLDLADLAQPEPAALKLLPAEWATRNLVLPLRQNDEHIVVAVAAPGNILLEEDIRFTTGRRPSLKVASAAALRAELQSAYAPENAAETVLRETGGSNPVLVIESAPAEVEALDTEAIEAGPIVKLTNILFADAVRKGASDIHISSTPQGGIVRYRVDGVLSTYLTLPLTVARRVVSRIKVLGRLDIADRLRPQDGRARIAIDQRRYDLRISTVPTRGHEKAVIRILDPMAAKDLDSIGLSAGDRAQFERLIGHREGIILITGPTGSGKTTTLYALLCQLATEEVNVMTVEDPIEYELPHVTQIQVEPAQGVTFATALRAILRQDPDIILVGEIRDLETAQIAVQASQTGHLVLATLHTNDAIGAVKRLADLGVDRTSIAETLLGAVAQRLVRRVCSCATVPQRPLTHSETTLPSKSGVQAPAFAGACPICEGHGYKGRVAVLEFFVPSPGVRECIAGDGTHGQILEATQAEGMKMLMDSGLDRVRSGDTTLEEVNRVLGSDAGSSVIEENPSRLPDPKTTLRRPVPLHESAPRARSDGIQTVVAMEPERWRAPTQPRILVVDDNRVDRRLARLLLERSDFEVEEATDGLEALEVLEKGTPFDAVVSDLDMPDLDGRRLLAALRSSAAYAWIPVLIQTSSSDPKTEAALIEAGADDYVRKPLNPARFIARVKAMMRRTSARSEPDKLAQGLG